MEAEQPTNLLDKLLEVRAGVVDEGAATIQRWRPLIEREDFMPSALNLAHYLALRRRDLRHLQSGLMPLGTLLPGPARVAGAGQPQRGHRHTRAPRRRTS
jgi:hypothetical protein